MTKGEMPSLATFVSVPLSVSNGILLRLLLNLVFLAFSEQVAKIGEVLFHYQTYALCV